MKANQEEIVNVLVSTMRESGLGLSAARLLLEKEYVRQAIFVAKGNKCEAARRLGIHRNTIHRMVAR